MPIGISRSGKRGMPGCWRGSKRSFALATSLHREVPPAPRAISRPRVSLPTSIASMSPAKSARSLKALAPLAVPIILLKGAAYAAAGLRAGRRGGSSATSTSSCRASGSLSEAEQLLIKAGWNFGEEPIATTNATFTANGCTSCRRCSTNGARPRSTSITPIVPPTSRFAVDGKRLRDAAIPVAAA